MIPESENVSLADEDLSNTQANLLLWLIIVFFCCALLWSYFTKIDRIVAGIGAIVPTTQVKIVQKQDGGILQNIYVHEGDVVIKQQVLLHIDSTQFKSEFRQHQTASISLKANIARLESELSSVSIASDHTEERWREAIILKQNKINFAVSAEFEDIMDRVESVKQQRFLGLKKRLSAAAQRVEKAETDIIQLNTQLKNMSTRYQRSAEVYNMTEPLVRAGVVSEEELLGLAQEATKLANRVDDIKLQLPKARAVLRDSIVQRITILTIFIAKARQQLDHYQQQLVQRNETQINSQVRSDRTKVYSPLKGIIKRVHVSTLGEIIKPGQDLVEIMPIEDTLLVEAKILPGDVGFLRLGSRVNIKLTAYDFSLYGHLKGELEHISTDTIADETGKEFYLLKVRASQPLTKQESTLPIIPSMGVSIDIITGQRRILDYVFEPLLRAKDRVLRER